MKCLCFCDYVKTLVACIILMRMLEWIKASFIRKKLYPYMSIWIRLSRTYSKKIYVNLPISIVVTKRADRVQGHSKLIHMRQISATDE
jgi:hypothetical protein